MEVRQLPWPTQICCLTTNYKRNFLLLSIWYDTNYLEIQKYADWPRMIDRMFCYNVYMLMHYMTIEMFKKLLNTFFWYALRRPILWEIWYRITLCLSYLFISIYFIFFFKTWWSKSGFPTIHRKVNFYWSTLQKFLFL